MKLQPQRLAKQAPATNPDAQIFARMLKVDTANRIVFGRAVQEVPDAAGEIFDYKSSKPYFEKWVEETKEATGGKSLGNIRAMHGATAAGKAIEVTFHDDECAIDIAAKVIDDNEWEKVLEGVYTGFSIGGAYVGKKTKDGDLLRYTASPTEISLVDKPCIPTAMFYDVVKAKGFTVIKADGQEERAEFKLEAEPVKKVIKADDTPPQQDEVEIEGTPEDVAAFGKLLKEHGLDLAKATAMVGTQIKVEAPKRFADTAAKKYPLDNEAQVLAAWYFVNTAKAASLYDADALKAIKDEVVKAWKERFGSDPEQVEATKAEELLPGAVRKSFYSVASAASMLQSLSYFLEDMRYWEEAAETEEALSVVGKVVTIVESMGTVIAQLISNEASKHNKEEAAEGVHLAQAAEGLLKTMSSQDEKKMKKRIQKAHDMMVEAGALCAPSKAAGDDLNKSLGADDLRKAVEKLTADIEVLKSRPQAPRATLRVVAKEHDMGTAGDDAQPGSLEAMLKGITPVLDSSGKVDLAATMIKVQHQAAQLQAPRMLP